MRILVVDDETDVRLITGISLSRLGGMDVIEAASGEEAIRLATQLRPDAIVLDVQMPGLTGIETLRAIREIPEITNTTVIFLTAHSARDDVEALLECGADAVLIKPFDPGMLAAQVRAVVERAVAAPPS